MTERNTFSSTHSLVTAEGSCLWPKLVWSENESARQWHWALYWHLLDNNKNKKSCVMHFSLVSYSLGLFFRTKKFWSIFFFIRLKTLDGDDVILGFSHRKAIMWKWHLLKLYTTPDSESRFTVLRLGKVWSLETHFHNISLFSYTSCSIDRWLMINETRKAVWGQQELT